MLCGQILQFPPHGGRSQIEAILPSESQLGGVNPRGHRGRWTSSG